MGFTGFYRVLMCFLDLWLFDLNLNLKGPLIGAADWLCKWATCRTGTVFWCPGSETETKLVIG